MNHVEQKKLVSFGKGNKAVLIFRGKYRAGHQKAIIDTYYPSPAYFEHIKGKKLVVKDGKLQPLQPRRNLNREGVHEFLINRHLGKFFNRFICKEIQPEQERWVGHSLERIEEESILWHGPNLSKLPVNG